MTGTHNEVGGSAQSVVQARDVRDITVVNVTADGTPGRPITAVPETRNLVPRPELTEPLIARLAGRQDGGVVALTAVAGAGGFGKTTLAAEACHDDRVVGKFPDGILWVTIGEHTAAAELASKINDLVLHLSGRRPVFTDPEQAGRHLGRLLEDRSCLLVVDDVWRSSQLTPFLLGGASCVRLVTTRVKDALPAGVVPIVVDAMTESQAMALLGANLPGTGAEELHGVLARTGKWPVLLALANRALGKYVQRGLTVAEAAGRLVQLLDAQGPAAVDINDAGQRNLAVAATVEASLALLESSGAGRLGRYLELAVFPEDVAIPQDVLEKFWGRTGNLTTVEVERLCSELDDLCLVQGYRFVPKPELRLHDVIRAYLRHRAGPDLPVQHRNLLDAHRSGAWWELPAEERYWWEYLWYHLDQAGLTEELNATACDFRWIMAALTNAGPDVADTFLGAASDPLAASLRRALRQSAHLLLPLRPASDLAPTLLSRLAGYAELAEYARHWSASSDRPRLFPAWRLPDLPHPSLRRAIYHESDNFIAVSISPDGSWFAAAPGDGTVLLFDSKGKERAVLRGHTANVCALAISPDGTWLASASADGTVRLWSAGGAELGVLSAHPGGVLAVAISPAGDWLASGGKDEAVRLWRPDGTGIGTLSGHSGTVMAVAVSPDGTWLASGGDDGTVRLWHPDGRTIRVLKGRVGKVYAVAVGPDGTWLAAGGTAGIVRLWGTDGREQHKLVGHESYVRDIALSPDGRWLASCGDDSSVRLWSREGAELRVLNGHTDMVREVVISPDGGEVISVGDDHTVRFWRGRDATAAEGTEVRGVVTDIAIDPTGSWLATTSHGETIRLWDAGGKVRGTLEAGTDWITSVAISSDATWLAAAGADSVVYVLGVDGTAQAALLGHDDDTWVYAIAISPDDDWLVSAGQDSTVRLWRPDGTALACLTQHSGGVPCLSISPDGSWFASGDGHAVIRLWDHEGTERHVLRGHRAYVNAVRISPDGTWLASASRDDTIRLWGADGAELAVIEGHGDSVNDVAISPDGRMIASCSEDRTIRLWSRETLDCVSALRTESSLDRITWFPSGDRIAVGGRLGPYVFDLLE
ncbi:NB-ARC domain-containing protein [Amycolatopsis vancoresmycina]|uniref:NB-ARC domain-containing protein n=1 Tax=Amycolatopsis vancoresmycina TaxID=208444 RepID=UPI000689A1EF|nr:NB-ARC domain-containing protein [Amycolatopsis vancoresmycina]